MNDRANENTEHHKMGSPTLGDFGMQSRKKLISDPECVFENVPPVDKIEEISGNDRIWEIRCAHGDV